MSVAPLSTQNVKVAVAVWPIIFRFSTRHLLPKSFGEQCSTGGGATHVLLTSRTAPVSTQLPTLVVGAGNAAVPAGHE